MPSGPPSTSASRHSAGWIPFSLEIEGDYPNLEGELLNVIADARGSVEADKFLTGSGTNEPSGMLTGLTTTQRV